MALTVIPRKSGHTFPIAATIGAILAILAVVLLYGKFQVRSLMSYAEHASEAMAHSAAVQTGTKLEFAQSSLKGTADMLSNHMEHGEVEDLDGLLEKFCESSPFSSIHLEDGSSGGGLRSFYDPEDHGLCLEISEELIVNGHTTGVLVGHLNSAEALAPILEATFFGEPTIGFLIDENGRAAAVTHTLMDFTDPLADEALLQLPLYVEQVESMRTLLCRATDGVVPYQGADGEGRLCVMRVPDLQWYTAILIPASSFALVRRRSMAITMVAIFAILLVLFVFVWVVIIRFRRERRRIADENQRLEEENRLYTEANLRALDRLRAEQEVLQEQFYLAEAMSRDTQDIFMINVAQQTSYTVKMKGSLIPVDKRIGRSYSGTWAYYIDRYVHPDDRKKLAAETALEHVIAALEKRDEFLCNYRIVDEKGGINNYQVAFSYLGQKTSGKIVFGFRNVDAIVRAEQEQNRILKEARDFAEEQLELSTQLNARLKENSDIIANAGYGIWRIDMRQDGHHTMIANDTLQKIFGCEEMNLSPEELYLFYHEHLIEDVDEIEKVDYVAMKEGALNARILMWEHPTKGTIFLNAGGTSYTQPNGEVIISGYCGDITSQRNEIVRLNESLERANRAKTDFLFSMSHDIRTPMNAIIGFTKLLKRNYEDRGKCMDYLAKIESSSEFLLTLINNVLEMARIDSGNSALNLTGCYVPEVIGELHSVFDEQMKEKKIFFTSSLRVQHSYVLCDSVKIREIFLNLLSNALKYTLPGGSVDFTVEELPCSREGYVRFQAVIADTGIGMSAEYLPHLFEEFSRERSATETRIKGTGLGMPIVKKLVDLMEGTIEVESEQGKGTTFTLWLEHPIAEALRPIKAREEQALIRDFSGKRILLAEDNELNAEITIELLKETGAAVELAEDGIVCVDLYTKAEAGYYDLILMDVQMPNMDGYKATELIRQLADQQKNGIPIIAMTANAFEADRRNAFAAGMTDHIAKPIDMAKLMDTLAAYLT